MNRKLVSWILLSLALCLIGSSNSLALENQTFIPNTPCGSQGTLFTNLSAQPTSFDLGATWAASCQITLSWTDANGVPHSISLSDAPVDSTSPCNSCFSSRGVSSSLRAGGSISWKVAAGTGNNNLNVVLERPPSSLVPSSTTTLGSATFGPVEGQLYNGLPCGSRGTLYNNLTSAPLNFDLMITNSSEPNTVGSVTDYCGITVYWRDTSGNEHTINLLPGFTQAVAGTNIPAGAVINWISTGEATAKLTVHVNWQLERAVTIQGQTF